MKTISALLSLTLLASAQQQNRNRQAIEQLTAEERAHMQATQKVKREDWIAAHPSRESTGFVALPDLGKGNYKGEQGGLYPGGSNKPPASHLKAGLALAK